MCACSRETDRFTSLSSTNARSLRRAMPPLRYTSTSRPTCTRAFSMGSSAALALPCRTTRRAGLPDPAGCSLGGGDARQPRLVGQRQAGRDLYFHPQALGKAHGIGAQFSLNLVLQVAGEEAATERRGPALFHAAHAYADEVEGKRHAGARAVGVAAHLFQHGEADLGQLRRAV